MAGAEDLSEKMGKTSRIFLGWRAYPWMASSSPGLGGTSPSYYNMIAGGRWSVVNAQWHHPRRRLAIKHHWRAGNYPIFLHLLLSILHNHLISSAIRP